VAATLVAWLYTRPETIPQPRALSLRDFTSILAPGAVIAGPAALDLKSGVLPDEAVHWLKTNFFKPIADPYPDIPETRERWRRLSYGRVCAVTLRSSWAFFSAVKVCREAVVELVVALRGEGASSDELRSLRAWLGEEDELRGCIAMRERPPAPGRLGPVLDALRIVADPAAAVLSATLVAWLRTRLGNVRLVVTDERGEEIVVEATHVRGLDADGVIELTEGLRRFSTGDADAGGRRATGDVSSRDDGGPVSGAAERPDV